MTFCNFSTGHRKSLIEQPMYVKQRSWAGRTLLRHRLPKISRNGRERGKPFAGIASGVPGHGSSLRKPRPPNSPSVYRKARLRVVKDRTNESELVAIMARRPRKGPAMVEPLRGYQHDAELVQQWSKAVVVENVE